jgi:hypothetical protein
MVLGRQAESFSRRAYASYLNTHCSDRFSTQQLAMNFTGADKRRRSLLLCSVLCVRANAVEASSTQQGALRQSSREAVVVQGSTMCSAYVLYQQQALPCNHCDAFCLNKHGVFMVILWFRLYLQA